MSINSVSATSEAFDTIKTSVELLNKYETKWTFLMFTLEKFNFETSCERYAQIFPSKSKNKVESRIFVAAYI